MTNKLLENRRFNKLVNLSNVVENKFHRKNYVSTLDIIIYNFMLADADRPKSLFEQEYHR